MTNHLPGSHPRFSVIIPTHNYGQYLPRAIDSVLAQEGAAFDLIVVDDGSTDETRQIVARYDNLLTYHYQRQQGPYVACKWAVQQTPPDRFVIFLDADDRLRPGYLKAVSNALARNAEAQIAFGRICGISDDGREKPGPLPQFSDIPFENFRSYILGRLVVSAGGAVIARNVFDPLFTHCGSYVSCHGFDRVVIAFALAHHPCAFAPDAVIEVHGHPGRLRHDINSFCETGLQVVEALFNPSLLSPEAMKLKTAFLSRLLLEQARLLYHHRLYPQARRAYQKAFVLQPAAVLRPRYLRHLLGSMMHVAFDWGGSGHNAQGASALASEDHA